ncbi:hypothetical protein ACHABX_06700 [Nesterenkonia halotolerans]|uniref:hypothetical protein n=1 Tax=Nesterenkonia halotolerans TaxID=225325 RepID=UPI003EE77FFD
MHRRRLTAALVFMGLAVVSPVLIWDWNDDGALASPWLLAAPFACGLIGAAFALWGRSIGLAVLSVMVGFVVLPVWIFIVYVFEAVAA